MPKTLLLADDSVTIQKVVGISFASEDIEIVTVDNGDDAVAKARELRPDVVLADVVMPGLSGYEVCEALKADPALRNMPVLLLTGTFEAFDEERASRAGAAGHVSKPFEAQTLVDRVKELLASPRPAAPAPASAELTQQLGGAGAAERDDAFDFFTDPGFESDAQTGADDTAAAPEPLDFDEPDSAFAFGDEDLAPVAQEPLLAQPLAPGPLAPRRDAGAPGSDAGAPPRRGAAPLAPAAPPDATVAILPESPTEPDDDDLEFALAGDDADAPGAMADPFAHTSLLDPVSGSGFDVSSSDLGPPEPARAARPPAPPPLPRDPVLDRLAGPPSVPTPGGEPPRPFGAEPGPGRDDTAPRGPAGLDLAPPPVPTSNPRPAAAPPPLRFGDDDALDADPVEEPSALAPEALGAGRSLDDDDPFGLEDGPRPDDDPLDARPRADEDPLDARPRPDDDPLDAEPLDEPDDAGAEPLALADEGAPGGRALSPLMREELRDTLEKVAWDAFGPVTEKIVRQAVERIEQVAWEVVPKLAETLIQEEIRRLKGETDAADG